MRDFLFLVTIYYLKELFIVHSSSLRSALLTVELHLQNAVLDFAGNGRHVAF